MASSSDSPSIFSMSNSYKSFSNVKSQTSATHRVFDQDNYNRTPVELNWYYTVTKDSQGDLRIELGPTSEAQMATDVSTVKASLSTQECKKDCFESMIRLATMVRTMNPLSNVLIPYLPATPIYPSTELADGKERQENRISIADLMLQTDYSSAENSSASQQIPEGPVEPIDTQITRYAFISAYLLRYAYRLPGDRWDDKMRDFQGKFSDMLGLPYNEGTPSAAWANSFNTLTKDLKHKIRIIICMVINTHNKLETMTPEHQKIYKYLFATPFSYYGMAVMIQLRKCADSLDVPIENFLSAMTVSELQTGIQKLTQTVSQASSLPYWPFARALDDSFFSVMSDLSVKRVHFVCLVILNMKGGQARPIEIEKVRAVAAVRDRAQLTELAADIVTAIDYSKPETTTSAAIKNMRANQAAFRDRSRKYFEEANLRGNTVVNQQAETIDVSKLMI